VQLTPQTMPIVISKERGVKTSSSSKQDANDLIKRVELDFWDKKQFDISALQLNIGDYTFVSQFTIRSL
jgi:hypothetical protein